MLQLPSVLFEAIGGIHIGKNFINSFQASRPFGKIEVYQDKIVLKVQGISDAGLNMFRLAGRIPFIPGAYKNIPGEIDLPYGILEGYKTINLGIFGYGITFIHSAEAIPPFLQIWLRRNEAKSVIEYLDTFKIDNFN